MNNKEKFKIFIQSKPQLARFVSSGQMTWQKFYEIYDLYGEDNKIWEDYENTRESSNDNATGISSINNLIKNVDVNSIKEHISAAQKALDLVQELTSKTTNETSVTPIEPRPLNKFFED